MDRKKIMLVILAIIVGLVAYVAISLLRLHFQVSNYQQYWSDLAATRPHEDAIIYAALGDSAAQGVGASQPLKGYVGLIAKDLEHQSGQPVHIINLGVSGAKTADITNVQLPKLKALNLPENSLVTVGAGANDMADYEPAKFKTDLEKLYSQLPIQTIVADIPYFGSGLHKSREKFVLEANAIIHDAAKKYNLKLAKLHESTKNGDSFGVHSYDFFHPSDKGYKNWYEAFRQVLRQKLIYL